MLFLGGLVVALTTPLHPPTVDLGYSQYRGTSNSTTRINSWKGIRFTAPPISSLRWKPPQPPVVNRTQILDATTYAPECPQSPLANQTVQPDASLASEDCLFLNVFSPQTAHNLPVMVWIHGGGYNAGNSQSDFTPLITTNNHTFVVVSIQYRLGAFGFLSSNHIHQFGTVNVGLLDQNFALEWIQSHISLFGGDPHRVTIAGESAGAGSVLLHSIAKDGRLATTLFQNLFAASPYLPWMFGFNHSSPSNAYEQFAIEAGCFEGNTPQEVVDCLRTKDSPTLQSANVKVSSRGLFGSWAFFPVIDAGFVTDVPSRLLARRRVNGRSVLVGNNAVEGAAFVPRNISTQQHVVTYLNTLLPWLAHDMVLEVLSHYPVDASITTNYATNGVAGADACSVSSVAHGQQARADNIYAELTFVCPSYWLSNTFSTSYRYQYSILPALHGSDLPAYLNPIPPSPTHSPAFSQTFQTLLGNFITKSNPSTPPTIPTWPNYSPPNSPAQMNLNQTNGTKHSLQLLGQHVDVFTQPGLQLHFQVVDASTWEAGRGARCELWNALTQKPPI